MYTTVNTRVHTLGEKEPLRKEPPFTLGEREPLRKELFSLWEEWSPSAHPIFLLFGKNGALRLRMSDYPLYSLGS